MEQEQNIAVYYTRNKLAERWEVSGRTIDRIRQSGRLPWVDFTGGQAKKPIVRFRLEDIAAYELKFRMAPLENITKEAA